MVILMAGAVCVHRRPDASCGGSRRASERPPRTLSSMQCAHHGLATGPDGRCALCRRHERAIQRASTRGYDPARTIAIVVVAIMAAVATFFLVGAVLDTR